MADAANSLPMKQDVVGTGISLVSFDGLVDAFAHRRPDRATVVTITNVHAVMAARSDDELRTALGSADISTPDGMPIAWALRTMGHPDQERLPGHKVTMAVLESGLERGWRHYFYGSTDETLSALQASLRESFSGIEIVGTMSPPFRDLTAEEEEAIAEEVMSTNPDFIWVGLGMPKQEKWMKRNAPRYPNTALVGIGAAFDFLAGTKPEAPQWMQRAGLEWLFRLASEPGRLWRRYVFNNPAYLFLWIKQAVGWKIRNRKAREGEAIARDAASN